MWGLCIGQEPRDPRRLAALAWQLPRSSRVWREIDPIGAHDDGTVFLRAIEYDIRAFNWSLSDGKTAEPEPMLLHGEAEARQRAEEKADNAAAELAKVFGLNL